MSQRIQTSSSQKESGYYLWMFGYKTWHKTLESARIKASHASDYPNIKSDNEIIRCKDGQRIHI